VNLLAGIAMHVVTQPSELGAALQRVEPDYLVVVPRVVEKIYARIAGEAQRGGLLRRAVLGVLLSEREPSAVERACLGPWIAKLRRRIFGRRIRLLVSGSAPLRSDARRLIRRLGVRVVDAYGVSECIVPIAMTALGKADDAASAAIGAVTAPNEVRLADDGEVLVRGPGVMSGYVGAASAPAFTADGFYRTGDLGSLDAEGRLSLHGRKNDVIKTSNGVKVHPSAIEALYAECPLVEHVAVLGDDRQCLVALATIDVAAARAFAAARRSKSERPDADGRDAIASAALELPRWFARLEEALPRSHRIARVAVVPSFNEADGTLTSSGKLRRRAIAELHYATVESLYRELARDAGGGRPTENAERAGVIDPGARGSSGSSAGRSPTLPLRA
jgi:long-chain acyl-CoA synthetase